MKIGVSLIVVMIFAISTAQAITITISAKNDGDQTYLVEKSYNMNVKTKGSVDFESLNVRHESNYESVVNTSKYSINVQGVKDNVKNYQIDGVVRADDVRGTAKINANPEKAEFSNEFEGNGKIEAYASSTKSDAVVGDGDPCDAPNVLGVENKDTAKVSLDGVGYIKSTQKAEFNGIAKAYSKTTIEGSYGYSAAWASKEPDGNGSWVTVKGGWWSYKLWIKGNESASTWAKFTDKGMLNTELYAEVGGVAKSYGNAIVKDTSIVDYGNAHYGRTDGDIYVTAESIWCGNLDAFAVSHSLNNHTSVTFAGIEAGNLSSTLKAETGSYTHANFTSKSSASHNEIYAVSEGKVYKSEYYWDYWNPWNPSNNSKKEVDAEGFGFSDNNETETDLNPKGVGP